MTAYEVIDTLNKIGGRNGVGSSIWLKTVSSV